MKTVFENGWGRACIISQWFHKAIQGTRRGITRNPKFVSPLDLPKCRNPDFSRRCAEISKIGSPCKSRCENFLPYIRLPYNLALRTCSRCLVPLAIGSSQETPCIKFRKIYEKTRVLGLGDLGVGVNAKHYEKKPGSSIELFCLISD